MTDEQIHRACALYKRIPEGIESSKVGYLRLVFGTHDMPLTVEVQRKAEVVGKIGHSGELSC